MKNEPFEMIMLIEPEAMVDENNERVVTNIFMKAKGVAPLVRCKECKHYFRCETRFSNGGGVVRYNCELNHENMRDDFYCADGERRTTE